jgi:hypothetical protein
MGTNADASLRMLFTLTGEADGGCPVMRSAQVSTYCWSQSHSLKQNGMARRMWRGAAFAMRRADGFSLF